MCKQGSSLVVHPLASAASMAWLIVTAWAHAAAGSASQPVRPLADARSAIDVLQANYYMPGLGSWIGHGPGSGRHDSCTADANQSCTCNGYQANWVRANTVEALCNYQLYSGTADLDPVIESAWPADGFELEASAPLGCNGSHAPAMPRQDRGWPYYDDVLWWALSMLRCAEMHQLRSTAASAKASALLRGRAELIFEHVAARAWNESAAACGGGIWWSTHHSYKNAIANELFLAAAAKLNQSGWAVRAWRWFESSGMINGQSLINDGLDAQCQNNQATTYSYNQGVILGGLAQLYLLTRNQSLVTQAEAIADAVLLRLTDADGVLAETGCGDGALFKGIFVRYLRYMLDAGLPLAGAKEARYERFLKANADAAWQSSQDIEGKFGGWWAGRTVFESATVGLQTAAIDALNAAQRSAPNASASEARVCLNGSAVRGRCVCRTRFSGERCDKEIGWPKYYANRRVVVMTPSGRFMSSGEHDDAGLHTRMLDPTQSHVSEPQKFTVRPCGTGVGLQDSSARWLAVTNHTGEPELVAVASQAGCTSPNPSITFIVAESRGLVTIRSAVASNLYLGTATIGGAEAIVVQTIADLTTDVEPQSHGRYPTPVQTPPVAQLFHISLEQSCQDF